MHFTVSDICNQNGCLISVTLRRFKYRTNTNGATLYTETSETLKMIETHFYHCWLLSYWLGYAILKKLYHYEWAMVDKWVKTLVCGRN